MRTCPSCKTQPVGLTSTGKQLDYCEACQSKRTKEKYRRSKALAVSYKGGACETCGYNKCQAALCLPMQDGLPYMGKINLSFGSEQLTSKLKSQLDERQLICMICERVKRSKPSNKAKLKFALAGLKGGCCERCGLEVSANNVAVFLLV